MSLPDDNKSFVGFFFRLPVKKFENTFVKNKWRKKKTRNANVRDDTQNNKLLLVRIYAMFNLRSNGGYYYKHIKLFKTVYDSLMLCLYYQKSVF